MHTPLGSQNHPQNPQILDRGVLMHSNSDPHTKQLSLSITRNLQFRHNSGRRLKYLMSSKRPSEAKAEPWRCKINT